MPNPSNNNLGPHNLGEAIERLRDKWGAIVANGVRSEEPRGGKD